MEIKTTRRQFVAGGVAAAGMGMLGVGASAQADEKDPEQEDAWTIEELAEPSEKMECDVLVAGGGGTGMCATVQAAQLGLNVILAEKNPYLGGAFSGTEGMFAIDSRWQKEAGVEIDRAEHFSNCMTFHHWVANADLYELLFDRSAETVEWCEAQGVAYAGVGQVGTSPVAFHAYEGAPHPGQQFVASMSAAVESCGATVEYELAVKRVLTDESGAVCGALAVRGDGTVVEITAPVVVLATGGYPNNPALIEEFGGNADLTEAMFDDGRVGDGIKAAHEVGAAMAAQPGTLMSFGAGVRGSGFGLSQTWSLAGEPALLVNESAERFMGEDMASGNFAFAAQAEAHQGKIWPIFNQALLDEWMNEGSWISNGLYVVAGEPMTGLADELPQYMEDGLVLKCDTIAELAEAAGLDPDALQATLDTYNEMCRAGEDTQFHKPAEFMVAMEEGPWYTIDCSLSLATTVGGLKVNARAEVLDTSGAPIRGLYAGGCDAGGLYGDTYDVALCPGSQACWCALSGRVAAEQAAQYLGK